MTRNLRSMVFWALSSAVLAACAGSGTPDGPSDGGGGSASVSNSTGSVAASSASSSSGSAGTGGAGTGGGGIGGTAGPDETPYFTTPELLCNYVNQARQTSSGHDRYRGRPWQGEYHMTHFWPLTFTVDQTLMDAAQAEADALAAGASPQGFPHNGRWVAAGHTSSPMERPGGSSS
jgi:hypothetical protein